MDSVSTAWLAGGFAILNAGDGARSQDPCGRLRDRPRLPLRVHSCVVAAVEGHARGGLRPDRDPVPRTGGGSALVAHRAQSLLSRGRAFRAAARRGGEGQGGHSPSARRGASPRHPSPPAPPPTPNSPRPPTPHT